MIPIITIDGPVSSGKGTVAPWWPPGWPGTCSTSVPSTGCWGCTPRARAWPWMTSRR